MIVKSSTGPSGALLNMDPKPFHLTICMKTLISLEDSKVVEFAAVAIEDIVPSFAKLFPAISSQPLYEPFTSVN